MFSVHGIVVHDDIDRKWFSLTDGLNSTRRMTHEELKITSLSLVSIHKLYQSSVLLVEENLHSYDITIDSCNINPYYDQFQPPAATENDASHPTGLTLLELM